MVLAVIAQGEIWWGELPDEKPRPFLVLTRQRAIDRLPAVMVAPVTTRLRGLNSEVALHIAEGLRRDSAASMDNVRTVDKVFLTRRIGRLGADRWEEVCDAMRTAIDC